MMVLFRALPLLWQLGIGAALLAGAGTAYGVWHYKIYSRGYAAAISDIAKKDKGALDAVKGATTKVDDCFERGGVWDATRGVCG